MTGVDTAFMSRALELAERGRGWVEPNPLVGAVVLRDGKVVGEGWHQRFGEAHAEVNALAAAGKAARGATLYVTLEPCCHQGKTPPCTDAILHAGIRRVVAAVADPFPAVAGQGAARLRAAGVEVVLGVCQGEAKRQNAPYLKLLATGRPYVHAKWAMTLDGKIATRTGDSRWISNEASRRRAHVLRGRMDAIVIGIGTALADDPLLTARPPGPRVATRIVLDSRGRLPSSSKLVQTAAEAPILVAVAAQAGPGDPAGLPRLRQQGCEVLPLPAEAGRPAVDALLADLGGRRMTNVLEEGGADVLGAFFDAQAVDEVHVFIAPKVVGGTSKGPVAGLGIARMENVLCLDGLDVEAIGTDVYLRGRVGTGLVGDPDQPA
jgi:diaminohydroxyphosphoribosylaminopyrimidine deaminase/5-amino-6-(5-phosphoribosylamino)uracil reductase